MYNDGLQVIIESGQALCETIGGHLGLVPNQAVADLVSQFGNTIPDANVIPFSVFIIYNYIQHYYYVKHYM